MEDMYNIWEVHFTGIYNKWLQEDRAIREARNRKR